METGSAAIIEQGIINRLSWLERLLARPQVNAYLPERVRIDESEGWFDIESELGEIF